MKTRMALWISASFGLGVAVTVAVQRILARRKPQPHTDPSITNHNPTQTLPHQTNTSTTPTDSLKYVHPPHAAWLPGQKQPTPFTADEMLQFDPSTVDVPALYSLMISAVVPRPIGFVSSMSADGSFNLAPYSYFNVMGHSPPILALGCCRHGGRPKLDNGEPAKKDTLANIEETGEYVVNIISDWFVEAANFTCGDYDRGQNEMQLSGLTPVPSLKVKPPRVAESAVQMECKVKQIIHFPDRNGVQSLSVVLGEVVMCHVQKEVTELSPTGKVVVDPIKLRPICRLGGLVYGRVAELFELPRPNKDGSFPKMRTKAQEAHDRQQSAGKIA